jgi:hypothetical protein
MAVIPADAVLIFESKQSLNTWRKLSQTNIMWEELLGTKVFAELDAETHFIDSILQTHPDISALLNDRSLFISVHPDDNSSRFLFTYNLPNRTYQDDLEDFFELISENGQRPEPSGNNEHVKKLKLRAKKNLFFSFIEGNLVMSKEESLINDCYKSAENGNTAAKNKDFERVIQTAGKKTDANLYVNYKFFPGLLRQFVLPAAKKKIISFSNFASHSGWDIIVKPNALMLSGFTVCSDSSGGEFLDIFRDQKPQPVQITQVLPYNTALMIFYGISDPNAFHLAMKAHMELNDKRSTYENSADSLQNAIHVNPEELIWDNIDSEIALVITEPSNADPAPGTFAVIHSNNIETALSALNTIADSAAAGKETEDTTTYKGHLINRIRIPRLLPHLLGTQFAGINAPHYTTINDYIVFGNSVTALQDFITTFENNKTLSNDKNYQSFAENISAEANFYLYSAIGRSTNLYKHYLSPEYSKDISDNIELYRKFESAGIQFSYNEGMFYSNAYLKYNPVHKQETTTLWESPLDTTLSSKPFLLINHNTKAKEVFVQDDANRIYLISNTGKIIWTKQLQEKIMSDVLQVDVLKNDKLQLIFNTRSKIYMFDRNGNDMKGFPITLKHPATNALSVVDYENSRDYRIFIATEDRKLNCFNAAGETVKGFEAEKTKSPVYLPVQYFRSGNRDNLCAVDVKGMVSILDRHGKIRLQLQEQLAQGIRNFFIDAGKDNSKTTIVASDTSGTVMRISLSGNKEELKFQDFETSPYFDYKDLNNDKTKEYIFVTRTELKVFNADKSLLFSYPFVLPVNQIPQFFLFPDGTGKIGIASEAASELYLFNDNGSLYNSFPLKGKTPFSIGDLNNEGIFNIVTGSPEKSIYVYQLQ